MQVNEVPEQSHLATWSSWTTFSGLSRSCGIRSPSALDLPGMGWSDIVSGARYEEPDLRDAVVEFVTALCR